MEENILRREEALRQAAAEVRIGPEYQILGQDAFKNNIRLRRVFLSGIREIDVQAFYACTSLRQAEYPKAQVIRKQAFGGCSHLKRAELPEGLFKMEREAFAGCRRLDMVSFGGNRKIREIPRRTFYECLGLARLELPPELLEIGEEAFYKCESLKTVRLPKTLKKIGRRAFYQCGFLELKLPEELLEIGESAFLKCRDLEYIFIPETVHTIGKWAFHGCTRLKVLEIAHDPPEIGAWITNKNCTIRCPRGSRMEEYARHYGMSLEETE